MRRSGLPLATSGSRANNTPCQTPLCPKRRPPRPQQPIFSIFRRGGLHFEHHTTTNRDLTTTKRGNFATRGSDTSATRHQKASYRKPHQRQCGGCRRARLRCRWAAAGPGRASRRRAERSSRRGRRADGPPPTGTPSSPAAIAAGCEAQPGAPQPHNPRVIGQNVLVEGLVPGVVVGGGVVEFVEADCVAPAGDGAGGLVVLRGLLPGVFEVCVGGHGRQDCCCWLRVG